MKNNIYQVGGALPANAKTYIEREADTMLYNALREAKYCYVLNARQVGKSSLRVQISDRLTNEGYKCVNIDITSIGAKDIKVEEFYFSFVFAMIEQLGLDEDIFFELWDSLERLTIINRFAKIMDKILDECPDNIVIFLDEIDSLLSIDIFSTDDFFAVIRNFYNMRSEDSKYNRLSFTLFGVATAEDLMRDSSRTPFNIAHNIKLTQLNITESMPLIHGLTNQSIEAPKILEKVFAYTSGTPYLTQKILEHISSNPIDNLSDIDKIIDEVFIKQGFEETNISNIQNRILNQKDYSVKMLNLISSLLKVPIKSNDGDLSQIYLKLSGLVKNENGYLVYTNKIYEEIFNSKWLRKTLSKMDRPFTKDLDRWLELDKDKSALLRGEVLIKVQEWANNRDDLSNDENLYLRESIANEEKKNKEKIIIIATISILIILFLSLFFYIKSEEQQLKLDITSSSIDKRLKILKTTLDGEIEYEIYTIPDSIDKKVKIDDTILEYFNVKEVCDENSAIVKILFNIVVFSDTEKKLWFHNLSSMSEEQKVTFFKILQYKAKEGYFELAQRFKKNKKYQEAIDAYRKSIELNIQSAKAYYHIGDSYHKLKEYHQAIKSYDKSLKLKPQQADVYYSKGKIYRRLKEYETALNMYLQSAVMNPNEDGVYASMGSVCKKLKEYNQSIEYYEKALKRKPNQIWIYNDMGDIYYELKKYKKAIEAYKKVYPKDDKIHYKMGITYNELEEYSKAIESYKEIIFKDDKVHYKMGIVHYNSYFFIEAIEAYEKVNFKDDKVYYKMGIVYSKLAEYKNAIEAYKKVNSKDDKVYYRMGILYRKLNENNKAIEAYKKINSKDKYVYSDMGEVYYKLEEYKKGIKIYKKLIEINYKDEWSYDRIGLAYNKLKEYKKAIKFYKKVIKINPNNAMTYYDMGGLYSSLGEFDQASNSYREAIKVNSYYNNSYLNIFELQLIQNQNLDTKLEKNYIGYFSSSISYLSYEMLKILEGIYRKKDYELSLEAWQEKYNKVYLGDWSFDILDAWIAKIEEGDVNMKLLEAIKVFKEHK